MKSIYGERTCGDMPKDSPSKSCRPCIDESAVLQMSECSPTLVRSSVLKSGTQRQESHMQHLANALDAEDTDTAPYRARRHAGGRFGGGGLAGARRVSGGSVKPKPERPNRRLAQDSVNPKKWVIEVIQKESRNGTSFTSGQKIVFGCLRTCEDIMLSHCCHRSWKVPRCFNPPSYSSGFYQTS